MLKEIVIGEGGVFFPHSQPKNRAGASVRKDLILGN